MNKELNPELFGDAWTGRQGQTKLLDLTTSASTSASATAGSETANFLNTDRQILELRQQIGQMAEELRKLSAQTGEFMKTSHLRIEKLVQQLHKLEQGHNGLVQETGQRMTQIGQRFAERKSMDAKIQEMVDRHTNVIKSFEVRMHHLQRLLTEKEGQLVGAQAAINEAKMEIARLKRL